MVATAFFRPADLFRKSALSQLEFVVWVGTSKKGWGDCMHSPVLSKGIQTRRGLLHWPWLTSQQQAWGYPGLGHQNLFYSKGYFWWEKSYSNVTRRQFNARQALPLWALLCAAPQSSMQPGWTLPSSVPSCAWPPLITTWNSLPRDFILCLLSHGNLVPYTSHQSRHI